MKISMEILTAVEFEISPDTYPAGMDPETARSLEIEQASQDPHEYVAMRGAQTSVVGRLVRNNGQPVRMRDLMGWCEFTLKAREESTMASMDDLSPEERRFLLQIGDAGVVAFNPRDDEVIAALLDAGFIDTKAVDDRTDLLRLTLTGYKIAALLRHSMG